MSTLQVVHPGFAPRAGVCEAGPGCTRPADVVVSNSLACTALRACERCLADVVLTQVPEPDATARLTVLRLGQ